MFVGRVDAKVQSFTYGEFSLMFEKSAGQFWSGDWKNQWAWEPQGNNVSYIRWGDPNQWPPNNYEKFELSKDKQWVLLDGYGNDQGLLKQRVDEEWIGDVNCKNLKPLPKVDGGKQHYVKWNIPAEPYCLIAKGKILNPDPKKTVQFEHKQVWFPPSGPTCSNKYFKNQICIKQYEVWTDNNDNGNVGGPMVERIRRDNIIAKGLGPAFIIHNYNPNNGWQAELRYTWHWG